MSDGLTLGGAAGTIVWTMDAATTAALPGPRVRVKLELWPGIPKFGSLYGYWPLNEVSGTRVKALGSATSADLPETGGAVASAAGKFGLAVSSAAAVTNRLVVSASPALDFTNGFTLAYWFYPGPPPTALSSSLVAIGKLGNTHISTTRFTFAGKDFITPYINWGPTYNDAAYIGFVSGFDGFTYTTNAWHLLVMWLDPTTRVLSAQVDNGTVHSSTALTPTQFANFTGLDSIGIAGIFHAGFEAWTGRIDEIYLWTHALIASERETLYGWPPAAVLFSGDLSVLDAATTLIPSADSWTDGIRGWTADLSSAVTKQGDTYSGTLTIRDATGTLVDLTRGYAKIQLEYDPVGSSTKLQPIIPAGILISGHIYYTQYAGTSPPRPTPAWPSVTVELNSALGGVVASTTADSAGYYEFLNLVAEGEEVWIYVANALPPGEAMNENGTSAHSNAVMGTLVIDLTCDRPPI